MSVTKFEKAVQEKVTEECKLCFYYVEHNCCGASEDEFLEHQKSWDTANEAFQSNPQSRFNAIAVAMSPTPCIALCSVYRGHEHKRDERDIENERFSRFTAHCSACGSELLWTSNGGTICEHCKYGARKRIR